MACRPCAEAFKLRWRQATTLLRLVQICRAIQGRELYPWSKDFKLGGIDRSPWFLVLPLTLCSSSG